MKKLLFSLAICVAFFTACSDDDDDNNSGSARGDVSVINTDSGKLLLTSNGRYNFDYDEAGNCVRVYNSEESYNLSDPYNVVTEMYEGHDHNNVDHLSYNKNGYVSKVEYYGTEESDEVPDVTTISYNKNNQISQLRSEESEIESNQTWTRSETTDFEYENETLKTVFCTEEETYYYSNNAGYGGWTMTSETVLKFTPSDIDNEYQQIPTVEFEFFCRSVSAAFWALNPFYYVGWCGKGSKKLFSKIEVSESSIEIDSDSSRYEYSDDYSWNLEYTLNSDGTIATEECTGGYRNYGPYEYSYKSFE